MAKVFLLVVLYSLVFDKVVPSNETCSEENSKVFQYFEELFMSQNFITVTDGIRMRRKSSKTRFVQVKDGAEECGSWTMRNIENNIDKIMNNFVLEFDLSEVPSRGGWSEFLFNQLMTSTRTE